MLHSIIALMVSVSSFNEVDGRCFDRREDKCQVQMNGGSGAEPEPYSPPDDGRGGPDTSRGSGGR